MAGRKKAAKKKAAKKKAAAKQSEDFPAPDLVRVIGKKEARILAGGNKDKARERLIRRGAAAGADVRQA